MNGQNRQREFPLAAPARQVTFSVYLDTYFAYSTHRPRDHTLVGTASVGRHGEFQLNLAGAGVEWNYQNIIGRLSVQTGDMLDLVHDQDASVQRGRQLSTANLRNIREAAIGYHWDVHGGLNAEAGILPSFIGLESYLLAENWNYNRSFVSEFTPFYLQGVRVQYFPNARWKIEPWIANGWQSFAAWNEAPSLGLAASYRPREALAFNASIYTGTDTRGDARRRRVHTDHSMLARYLNAPSRLVSKAALSVDNHFGYEHGGSAEAAPARPLFLGSAVAHRLWLGHDRYAITIRGELVDNPTRYLAITPTPAGFSDAGSSLHLAGATITFDVLPNDFFAWRFELLWRRSNVPYFAGDGGTTSADGFRGTPGTFIPDLRTTQSLLSSAITFRL